MGTQFPEPRTFLSYFELVLPPGSFTRQILFTLTVEEVQHSRGLVLRILTRYFLSVLGPWHPYKVIVRAFIEVIIAHLSWVGFLARLSLEPLLV